MDADARELALSVRRFLDQVVHAAAVDVEPAGPSLAALVDAHLGVSCTQLPVVREEIPEHQFVDLDLALSMLGESGGGEEVVGVSGGEQRGHHGFSEIMSGRYGGFGVGAVDRVNCPRVPRRAAVPWASASA